ncbi:hypothetical protein LXM94_02740 [Rhizobium sp. TRM95111]|uniref:hypothetical protein n=1 Tax=Rhizobium alarense TaxID=2846851 RepID=UPI001F3EDF87|nr:hypothetical protein [Rhizobium alarense]MCF3638885.1 hypothetical protein [Rhizobium alarense]
MIFGQSVFETVVARLAAEAAEREPDVDGPAPSPWAPPAGLAGSIAAGKGFVFGRQAEAAYLDMAGATRETGPEPAEPPAAPPEPELPPHLARVSPQDVAEDLALTGRESAEELAGLRRAFARANHPDSVHPRMRENATIRMKIANMLIDETMRRIAVERKLGL